MRTVAGRPVAGNLVFDLSAREIGFRSRRLWCPVPTRAHKIETYSLPKTVVIATRDTEDACAKFSPSPYAVVIEGEEGRAFIGVAARRGWHRWNYVEFRASADGARVIVDLEGHTPPRDALRRIGVHVLPAKAGESNHALLRRGLAALYPAASRQRPTPSWWLRPIYCGWGDQVGMSLALEGPGPEPRAMAYCTQGLYERWIRRLDEAGVPFGAVIVDAGWSLGGVWRPNLVQWPDMKGFIARQHEKGRRVLLWIATWFKEGLPEKWCVRSGGTALVADPGVPAYRRFLADRVRELLSPQGYDADGFKIDQLSYVPSERTSYAADHFGRRKALPKVHPRIRTAARTWGCELLYALQKDIYRAAKSAKPDALVTSSTVHPYFHDTFDMVRLHDTGRVAGDVIEAMKTRSDLSLAALPRHPIDADDWIPYDYRTWMDYTCNSHNLGVPCLFYAENFVRSFREEPTVTPLPLSALRKVARAWREHLTA